MITDTRGTEHSRWRLTVSFSFFSLFSNHGKIKFSFREYFSTVYSENRKTNYDNELRHFCCIEHAGFSVTSITVLAPISTVVSISRGSCPGPAVLARLSRVGRDAPRARQVRRLARARHALPALRPSRRPSILGTLSTSAFSDALHYSIQSY